MSPSDLPIFYEQQLDPAATHMAAVASRDADAFSEHWRRILCDESIEKRTIMFEGRVAGYLVCFERGGRREVGYWIGRQEWGKGIATQALSQFLHHVHVRPLHGCVVKHNQASVRVLEKCGFVLSGKEKEFIDERGAEVEGFILTLDERETGDESKDQLSARGTIELG